MLNFYLKKKNSKAAFEMWHLYLSGCHKHSNRCNSLHSDNSERNGSQQHGGQNLCDKADTGQVLVRCSACRSCHRAHRFPTHKQWHTSLHCTYRTGFHLLPLIVFDFSFIWLYSIRIKKLTIELFS